MTDIFDRATELEERQREAALDAARWRYGRTALRPSAEECRICGEPIPPARRLAVPGVETCVECQADLERGLRLED